MVILQTRSSLIIENGILNRTLNQRNPNTRKLFSRRFINVKHQEVIIPLTVKIIDGLKDKQDGDRLQIIINVLVSWDIYVMGKRNKKAS
jgi:hypothetical protein